MRGRRPMVKWIKVDGIRYLQIQRRLAPGTRFKRSSECPVSTPRSPMLRVPCGASPGGADGPKPPVVPKSLHVERLGPGCSTCSLSDTPGSFGPSALPGARPAWHAEPGRPGCGNRAFKGTLETRTWCQTTSYSKRSDPIDFYPFAPQAPPGHPPLGKLIPGRVDERVKTTPRAILRAYSGRGDIVSSRIRSHNVPGRGFHRLVDTSWK